MDKIKHEEIDTCSGTEIGQDTDNSDQKVKWVPKVHKTYRKHTFNYFSQVFILVHILQFC